GLNAFARDSQRGEHFAGQFAPNPFRESRECGLAPSTRLVQPTLPWAPSPDRPPFGQHRNDEPHKLTEGTETPPEPRPGSQDANSTPVPLHGVFERAAQLEAAPWHPIRDPAGSKKSLPEPRPGDRSFGVSRQCPPHGVAVQTT